MNSSGRARAYMKNVAINLGTSHGYNAGRHLGAYASPEDFCAIFTQDVDSLYSLALALTRSHEKADQCYLASLDDCRTGNAVFSEWARSWSRRAVIKNAIRMVVPVPGNAAGASESTLDPIADQIDPSARSVLRLNAFDRFVFVISVLEGYTLRECAALLGSSLREAEQARVRALQQIAGDSRNLTPAPYDGSSHSTQSSVLTLH